MQFQYQKKSSPVELYKGDEIYNNSIGIIGFGRIGKLLAKYIEAFNEILFMILIRQLKKFTELKG